MRARTRMALQNSVRRRAAAGFTLMELMIVVLMISILAIIATPGMTAARDDRLAFDYARRVEQLIQRGRVRASGRGAAHLFVADSTGPRGRFLLFEALDGAAPGAPTFGPNPVSSCRTANQWATVPGFVPGVVNNTAAIIDGVNLNAATGVNVDMDLRAAYTVNATAVNAVVICVTPSGTTWVGQGGDMTAAIADMNAQVTPSTSDILITLTRNRGGVPIGLRRSVIVAGAAAARIRSQ